MAVTTTHGDAGTLKAPDLTQSLSGEVTDRLAMGVFDTLDTLSSVRYFISWTVFSFWCFQWLLHIMSILHGKYRLHGKSVLSSVDLQSLLGVSVLKPLTGVDPNLYANLETFFNMNYPKYELLFCIENEHDPAIMVVRSLLDKYPKMDAHLYVGGTKKVGVNPKINNMIEAYEAAKYDLMLISDSGLRMKEDTLMDMVLSLTESVGLVHQIPFVSDREGFSGVLEKVYFGSQHAKIYLISDMLGINCVTGMSCLFRKDVLEQAGSLKSLGCYLAEDYHLAKTFVDRGWRLRISANPALQNAGTYSVSNFQARMIRWIKLRTSLIPLTAVLEPASECLLMGVAGSWAVSSLFDWSGLAFFFVHALLWFLLDYILLLVLQMQGLKCGWTVMDGVHALLLKFERRPATYWPVQPGKDGPVPFSKFEYVIGWLFRELTSISLMIRAHCSRVLTWRNRHYLLKRGGIGEELKLHSQQLFV